MKQQPGLIRLMRLISPIGHIGPIRLIRLLSPIRPIRLIGLIGFIVSIGLVSCSGDGGVTDPEATPVTPTQPQPTTETPISFRSGLVSEEPVTRAEGLENNATSFKVWAYKNMSYDETEKTYGSLQTVIDGYAVNWVANTANTTTTNTHDWEYVGINEQTIKYWDWSAKAYRFFGVTDMNMTAALKDDGSSVSFSLIADATSDATATATPYFTKLWKNGSNSYGRLVTLEFLQPFAKVRFMFTVTDPDMTVVLEDKRFKPTSDSEKIYQKAEVSLSYPMTSDDELTWSLINTNVSEKTSTIEDNTMTVDYTDVIPKWYLVVPPASQGTFTLNVKVNGQDRTVVVPESFMQWRPGYQYTYIFKITEAGGVELESVQGAFKPWQEEENDRQMNNW